MTGADRKFGLTLQQAEYGAVLDYVLRFLKTEESLNFVTASKAYRRFFNDQRILQGHVRSGKVRCLRLQASKMKEIDY